MPISTGEAFEFDRAVGDTDDGGRSPSIEGKRDRRCWILRSGEPDFDTPANIQQAAWKAISGGQTHYTPPAGIPELRQAIAGHYSDHFQLPTEAAQVVVSNGAKHSLHNALMAVCGPGDEVVIPAPYWVSYSDLVKLTGADARHHPYHRRLRIQAHAAPASRGDHASNQAVHDQQPIQPHRRGLSSRQSWKRWPT